MKSGSIFRRSLVGVGIALGSLGLGACGGAEPGDSGASRADALEGELVVYAITSIDGATSRRYALRREQRPELALEFDAAPRAATGTPLRLSGSYTAPGVFRATAYDIVKPADGVAVVRQSIAQPTQTRRMALLMLHFGTPLPGVTEASLERTLFGDFPPSPFDPGSMSAFYEEASYGALSFEGDAFGWFQVAPIAGCDNNAATAAGLAAAEAANIDLSGYDHVGFLLPNQCNVAAAAATVGTPANPERFSWYWASVSGGIFVHELGHNIGFPHANRYDCGFSSILTADQCVSRDGGDLLDNMGNAGAFAHHNSYFKANQGWLAGCNVVTAPASGEFVIQPLEVASSALQTLRIPAHPSICPPGLAPCFYYVENREPIGFDGFDSSFSFFSRDGAVIRLAGAIDPAAVQDTHLITSTPATPETPFPIYGTATFPIGQTFQDPTGVRITALSDDAQGLRVQVVVPGGTGSPVCLGGGSTLTTSLSVYSNWATGYCAEIQIRNPSASPVQNWQLRLNVGDSALYTSWLAQFTSLGSSLYNVTPFTWNNTIQPGQMTTASFCANKTGPNFTPHVVSVTP